CHFTSTCIPDLAFVALSFVVRSASRPIVSNLEPPKSFLHCLTANKGCKNHKLVHDLVRAQKGMWPVVRLISEVADFVTQIDGTYNPFPNYSFSGTMRPVYPLSPKREVPAHIPRPDYALRDDGWFETLRVVRALTYVAGVPMSEMRTLGHAPRILGTDEIQKMRTACRVGTEAITSTSYWNISIFRRTLLSSFVLIQFCVTLRITTDELDAIVHQATIDRNAYPSPLNYRKFPKSVCTSINEVICHGIPDQRKLREGDIINLDISLYYDGKIDEDSAKLIRTTRECLDAAIKTCKPGALFRDIGKAIEPIARDNGCAVVRTYTGHGINNLFHTAPNIPHYAKNKAVGAMKPGMCFTIEPMINLGSNWEVRHWDDSWTATTIDGKRSAQFEETLLCVLSSPRPVWKFSRHGLTQYFDPVYL
ncbi:hypothetical protein ID866_4505, partial [Astraeus odoratus]